ncbi:MAG TPA: glycogen/starch synthase [Spirochaetota bacterium]|nr:glycogen/starch synthase [Spirochaetota bacterium]
MAEITRTSAQSSLSRYRLRDEHLVSDGRVKDEIAAAFADNRCFFFSVDASLVARIRSGDPIALYREELLAMKNAVFDAAAGGDGTAKNLFLSDTRLSSRLVSALMFVHMALAEDIRLASLTGRRFVIVRERPGVPTIFHVSNETTVISHVGLGPIWEEIPSLYLGMNIFDTLAYESKRGERVFFDAFVKLLLIEARAIETGYSHVEIFPVEYSHALNALVDEVIRVSTIAALEFKEAAPKRAPRPFRVSDRRRLVGLLDERLPGNEMNFNAEANLKAISAIERLARAYKQSGDEESLRETLRLLVAASGHDIHEVRDRANILLERIFAPKEFDAPLATAFATLTAGSSHRFEFELPARGAAYFVRLYRHAESGRVTTQRDIDSWDIELEYDASSGRFTASFIFEDYGHFDYVVFRKKKKSEWVHHPGASGRINVIPDVRGEIILEIFPDIHGHTRIYWMDGGGHPGLVYNEHGEVIRLGRFSDITAHLDDLIGRYRITALYLLGVQRRGSNREDWAPEASSPSPFSPMSLVEIEPSLGGEAEFRELVSEAHRRGVKVIVDVVPHLNRRSLEVPDDCVVQCYDEGGNLVVRASTDGRYGSWNDGKLFNYRKFEVWEWLERSITTLIERFDIDGIRFDSAHAVPIMMKKNNYPSVYGVPRSAEEGLEGGIVVNDREDGHFITTGYYDSACRDLIAIPLHYYLMVAVEKTLRRLGRDFFINIAECYWGHERFLTRVGIIPYNSALFKICENIIHGTTDVREIYHIYDNYFPSVMPKGTELLGILGNHDERRALNTFGHRGLRAAVGVTTFMNNIVMDYEGSAEGEGWKVFLDNIFVNWNSFEYAAHRSVERFYGEWYEFHRREKGRGYLVWANNTSVVASVKFTDTAIWIGVFNFAESNQAASIQFDNPVLPLDDDSLYRVVDPVYSPITGHFAHFTGRELKASRIDTVVSFTDRVKLLRLEEVADIDGRYRDFLKDSFFRMCSISNVEHFASNFAFREITAACSSFDAFQSYVLGHLVSMLWEGNRYHLELGLKRAVFHAVRTGALDARRALSFFGRMSSSPDERVRLLGEALESHNRPDSMVFMSAEADPFSKSGGLANVVYELPRELAALGETVYVITGLWRNGDEKAVSKMRLAMEKHSVRYTGKNVRFKIMNAEYEVGVHSGTVDGVTFYLLDHHEFFDGLYWGVTSEEKLRRRVAFARACAEVIATFGLRPLFTFTNDAYTGLFNGIVRSDHVYASNPNFARTTFLHVIHNGGWQYFDSYHRHERGFDLFQLFNLPSWRAVDFADPVHHERLNCMATGIRFADRVITVSPSYARQIEYACDGLERILSNVIGISNAVGRDFTERLSDSFRHSGFVERQYPRLLEAFEENGALKEKVASRWPEMMEGAEAVEGIPGEARRFAAIRARNKMMLQLERGLYVDPDVVLFSMIHRITEQKGFQLVLDASRGLFAALGYQAVMGGSVSSGDRRGEEIAHGMYMLSRYYPGNVSVSFGFQDIAVPLFSSDIFCMPSMSEPGGISQLEAFAAGCLVVARATGGLRDTVFPVRMKDGMLEGNGFLFTDFNATAFYDAMERAHQFVRSSDDVAAHMAGQNARSSIYHWDRPARRYIGEVYAIKEMICAVE